LAQLYYEETGLLLSDLRYVVIGPITEQLQSTIETMKEVATQHVPFSIRGMLDDLIGSYTDSSDSALDAFYSELDFVVLLENPLGKTLEYEY
jgi:hypothetical protein